jgi:hypothetical protein
VFVSEAIDRYLENVRATKRPRTLESAQRQTKLFVKPGTVTISRFVLRSFKGKIRVNRP